MNFNDASHIVQVIGKSLHIVDEQYPAPSGMVTGEAPTDVQLVRHKRHKKDDCPSVIYIVKHFVCKMAKDFDIRSDKLDFGRPEHQPRRQIYPLE